MSRKVVLVTGGSRGIGAATARIASERGWRVAVNYRSSKTEADDLVAHIREYGGEAISVGGDVASEDDVLGMFEACLSAFGQLDGLVNNAGILGRAARLDSFGLDRWNHVFAVNAGGTFLASREAVKIMSRVRGGTGGSIVNLSSMAAVLGGSGEFVDYAASKGAVEAMTVGLAREVAAEGIRVNAVRPGLILTEIHESSGDGHRAERLSSTVPLGRAGAADEVANAIVWLLSDEASYVTGAIFPVSGGR